MEKPMPRAYHFPPREALDWRLDIVLAHDQVGHHLYGDVFGTGGESLGHEAHRGAMDHRCVRGGHFGLEKI